MTGTFRPMKQEQIENPHEETAVAVPVAALKTSVFRSYEYLAGEGCVMIDRLDLPEDMRSDALDELLSADLGEFVDDEETYASPAVGGSPAHVHFTGTIDMVAPDDEPVRIEFTVSYAITEDCLADPDLTLYAALVETEVAR